MARDRRHEVHLYVREVDRQVIDRLPPEVSLSEIFRLGLQSFGLAASSCSHPATECLACHQVLPGGHQVATLT